MYGNYRGRWWKHDMVTTSFTKYCRPQHPASGPLLCKYRPDSPTKNGATRSLHFKGPSHMLHADWATTYHRCCMPHFALQHTNHIHMSCDPWQRICATERCGSVLGCCSKLTASQGGIRVAFGHWNTVKRKLQCVSTRCKWVQKAGLHIVWSSVVDKFPQAGKPWMNSSLLHAVEASYRQGCV